MRCIEDWLKSTCSAIHKVYRLALLYLHPPLRHFVEESVFFLSLCSGSSHGLVGGPSSLNPDFTGLKYSNSISNPNMLNMDVLKEGRISALKRE